jgi:hypothetical protein
MANVNRNCFFLAVNFLLAMVFALSCSYEEEYACDCKAVVGLPVYVNESGIMIKIVVTAYNNAIFEKFIAQGDTLRIFSEENADEWYSNLPYGVSSVSRVELYFLDDPEKCLIFDGPIKQDEIDMRSIKSYEKWKDIENWPNPYSTYSTGVEYIYTITPELKAMAKEGNNER